MNWLNEIVKSMGDTMATSLKDAGSMMSNAILDAMLKWIYTSVFDAIAEFFENMNNMGAEIFELSWVDAAVHFFMLIGWALYATGVALSIFDVAIEAQSGRANIQTTALNIFKGFMAASLISVLPITLYKFCITLQSIFSKELAGVFIGSQDFDIEVLSQTVLQNSFAAPASYSLFYLITMIAVAYCIIKVFFANIKRGGILLIQIAVGSLYMISLPRGYTDGFMAWCKQVIALCLTAFMQTTLLFLGLLTFQNNMMLGMGVMLAANEVPRIASQFGLDSSAKVSFNNVIHTTSSAVNFTRTIARSIK